MKKFSVVRSTASVLSIKASKNKRHSPVLSNFVEERFVYFNQCSSVFVIFCYENLIFLWDKLLIYASLIRDFEIWRLPLLMTKLMIPRNIIDKRNFSTILP